MYVPWRQWRASECSSQVYQMMKQFLQIPSAISASISLPFPLLGRCFVVEREACTRYSTGPLDEPSLVWLIASLFRPSSKISPNYLLRASTI